MRVLLQDLFARVKKNAGIDYDLTIDNVGEIFDLLFCEVCSSSLCMCWEVFGIISGLEAA